jgi:hypothetical protein
LAPEEWRGGARGGGGGEMERGGETAPARAPREKMLAARLGWTRGAGGAEVPCPVAWIADADAIGRARRG